MFDSPEPPEGIKDSEGMDAIDQEAVREALARGELFLEYLPLIAVPEGRCVGAEALVRWRRSDRVVMPNEFTPLIEETPLSGLLTYWVIETVAVELGGWLRANDVTSQKAVAVVSVSYDTELM
jgi:sensor c-di-GMP phosphodiesterase-like protein